MSAAGSRRLALALAVLTPLLLVASLVLELATGLSLDLSSDVILWALGLTFAAVGWLIASREPGNAIGWIFLGAAVAAGFGNLSSTYASYWVDDPSGPALPGQDGRMVRKPLVDPLDPRAVDLPAPALPRRSPGLATLAPAWRGVRGWAWPAAS